MPVYKVTYFNLKGRGELIRYIFALAGVEYEDDRIQMQDWPTFKGKTPHGYLPILDVDGKKLDQSGAIYRYLSREFGFAGSNSFEQAQIDMIHEITLDLLVKIRAMNMIQDEQQKAQAKEKLMKEDIERTFMHLKKIHTENNDGGDGYMVGRKLSFADIVVFSLYEDSIPDTMQQRYDLPVKSMLLNLIEKVRDMPQMKEWLKKRPVSPY